MWSPVEKTAIAEAEVEYSDIVSTQLDVAFEITESPIPELVGAHAVIWTTTPWTIPVNEALAYGTEVNYVIVEAYTQEQLEDKLSGYRIRYLVAEDLVSPLMQRGKFVVQPKVSEPIKGSDRKRGVKGK